MLSNAASALREGGRTNADDLNPGRGHKTTAARWLESEASWFPAIVQDLTALTGSWLGASTDSGRYLAGRQFTGAEMAGVDGDARLREGLGHRRQRGSPARALGGGGAASWQARQWRGLKARQVTWRHGWRHDGMARRPVPGKAVALLDVTAGEAAARLDGPGEIAYLERKRLQLKVEFHMLEKDLHIGSIAQHSNTLELLELSQCYVFSETVDRNMDAWRSKVLAQSSPMGSGSQFGLMDDSTAAMASQVDEEGAGFLSINRVMILDRCRHGTDDYQAGHLYLMAVGRSSQVAQYEY
ncbi:hypothetical protein PR202_gb07804 [Eleusine coracana subsp. coracana]|uniref:Uncharacterized protein n=1 Tax=Eleusine coracana subsp. coracana TaxID=191504 RepID=A0AAV5ED18_ELECO|nr:hypothetical protein PR202_gb07804 [Eleusine coracana subsp. coracana]